MTEQSYSQDYSLDGLLDWRPVERALDEGTASGRKIAIIETHKMLLNLLGEKRFPGKTPQEQLKAAQKIFSSPEQSTYALNMYLNILTQRDIEFAADEVKEIIAAYFQTMIDISEAAPRKSLGLFKRLRLTKDEDAPPKKWRSIVRWSLIGFLLFFFIVFLLDRTAIGASIVSGITNIASFLFTKLIIVVGGIALFFLLLFASFHHLRKRRTFDEQEEDEEVETDPKN